MSYQELLEKLKEWQKKLFDLKLQLSNQQLKDYMQIGQVRKEIARIRTILTEKRSNGELDMPRTIAVPAAHTEKAPKAIKEEKKAKAKPVKEKPAKAKTKDTDKEKGKKVKKEKKVVVEAKK